MAKRIQPRGSGNSIVAGCVARLRELSSSIEIEFTSHSDRETGVDGELTVRLAHQGRSERFLIQATGTHLSYALASGFIERARRLPRNSVVFAPYVPGPIGRHLAAHWVSFVDVVGNCHLETKARGLLVHVEGKKASREQSAPGAGRLASYQVIFSILAQPDLLKTPLRSIAAAAGTGKTAAGDQLGRLTDQGIIGKGHLLRRRDLLNRWLSAYQDVVRPAWLQGRYRTKAQDPAIMEEQIADVWREKPWAFGAGAAAWRMNPYYRGDETVIHVGSAPADELKRLVAIPDRDGPLTVLLTPGVSAYAGTQPHVAHPLLVYTEMITSPDSRMREAASEISERFLEQ
jgi:hypothetical protein